MRRTRKYRQKAGGKFVSCCVACGKPMSNIGLRGEIDWLNKIGLNNDSLNDLRENIEADSDWLNHNVGIYLNDMMVELGPAEIEGNAYIKDGKGNLTDTIFRIKNRTNRHNKGIALHKDCFECLMHVTYDHALALFNKRIEESNNAGALAAVVAGVNAMAAHGGAGGGGGAGVNAMVDVGDYNWADVLHKNIYAYLSPLSEPPEPELEDSEEPEPECDKIRNFLYDALKEEPVDIPVITDAFCPACGIPLTRTLSKRHDDDYGQIPLKKYTKWLNYNIGFDFKNGIYGVALSHVKGDICKVMNEDDPTDEINSKLIELLHSGFDVAQFYVEDSDGYTSAPSGAKVLSGIVLHSACYNVIAEMGYPVIDMIQGLLQILQKSPCNMDYHEGSDYDVNRALEENSKHFVSPLINEVNKARIKSCIQYIEKALIPTNIR
jgi:hypothetical protein